jgi:regulator of CtrA degradation
MAAAAARRLNSGEMSREQMLAEKQKMRLDTFNCDRSVVGWNELPETFRLWSSARCACRSYVHCLDRDLFSTDAEAAPRKPDNENSVRLSRSNSSASAAHR